MSYDTRHYVRVEPIVISVLNLLSHHFIDCPSILDTTYELQQQHLSSMQGTGTRQRSQTELSNLQRLFVKLLAHVCHSCTHANRNRFSSASDHSPAERGRLSG
eukprot:CAMPEP_0171633476 /NCGR_PEP_ID=MMETSP0990-20121206/25224_1 /TAXON_ID=483369 /ORGANISM="non described non described, Strain CCMP2098" /LENGTH=102 /DNA_ID=CAMNT_0012204197 /DNA_START=55 /DNA_END=359 /DNA_ORIENTATION=+